MRRVPWAFSRWDSRRVVRLTLTQHYCTGLYEKDAVVSARWSVGKIVGDTCAVIPPLGSDGPCLTRRWGRAEEDAGGRCGGNDRGG